MRHVLDPKRLGELDASGAQRAFELGSAIRALRGQTAVAAEIEVEALGRRLGAQLAAPTAVGAGGVALGLGAKWIASLVLACAVGLYAMVQLNSKPRVPVRHDAVVPTARPVAPPPVVVRTAAPAVVNDVAAPKLTAPVVKLSRHERAHADVRRAAPGPDRGVSPDAELTLLKQAQATLDHDATTALALAEQHAKLYPRGLFAQEREILAIEALLKLRQRSAALARAKDFVARYPDSPHARRVRSLIERSQFMTDPTIAPAPDHSATDTQR
jgi:hypothetical protein